MKGIALLLALCAQEQRIEWRTDYAAALKEAKETGRKLVILFGGTG